MRAPSLLPIVAVVTSAALLACGSAEQADPTATTSEDALRSAAHPPIAQVLQYVGRYEGNGSVSSLELRRDGTFLAVVDGARKAGRYEGPRKPAESIKLALLARGEALSATVPGDWTAKQRVVVTHAGRSETLTSPWNAGSEQMCDDTGGAWTDDDPDPATGLYCVCVSPKVYVPSAGGCSL